MGQISRRESSPFYAHIPLAGLLALGIAMLSGVVGAGALVRFFLSHVGHDQSWGLYMADHVLHGVKLNGPELVEVNPPFIVWFMSLPVLLSQLLHLNVLDGFRWFFIALVVMTMYWSTILFRRLYQPASFVLWSLIAIECCLAGLFISGEDIGQREHLVSYFLLPYLVAAAFRIERHPLPGRESCLIGLFAAVALCLKPQHALDVFLIEVVVLFRLRSLRHWIHSTWLTVAFGLILYVCLVRWMVPDYFTYVAPLLTDTYWGFNKTLSAVVSEAKTTLLFFGVTAFLYGMLRKRLRFESFASVVCAACAGAFLAYLQQHKGWRYQQVTFAFLVWLFFVLVCIDVVHSWVARYDLQRTPTIKPYLPRVAALSCFLIFSTLIWKFHRKIDYQEPEKHLASQVFSAYPQGTSVSYLSTYPWAFPTVVEQNKVLGSRYFHLWLLPAIIRSEDPSDSEIENHLSSQDIERLSTLLRTTEAHDLARWQPAVVVVESCIVSQLCDPAGRQYTGGIVGWLKVDQEFKEQWSHYTYQKKLGALDVYTRTQ